MKVRSHSGRPKRRTQSETPLENRLDGSNQVDFIRSLPHEVQRVNLRQVLPTEGDKELRVRRKAHGLWKGGSRVTRLPFEVKLAGNIRCKLELA